MSEAEELVKILKDRLAGIDDVEIAVCPPAVNLVPVYNIIADSNIKLGAQNMYWEESGAYTGEISGPHAEGNWCYICYNRTFRTS